MGDFRKKREDGSCPLKTKASRSKRRVGIICYKKVTKVLVQNTSIYITTLSILKKANKISCTYCYIYRQGDQITNVFANYNIPLFYLHSFGNQYPEVFCIHHPSVCHLPVMGSDFLPINMQKITLITSGVASFLTHSFPMNSFSTP